MKSVRIMIFLLIYLIAHSAMAMDVPIKIQVPLLFKVFSFEKNIQNCSDEVIRIAVVYNSGDSQSIIVKDEVMNVFKANSERKVRGKSFSVVAVGAETDLSQFHVAYFAPGNDAELSSMLAICNSANVLSVTGEAAYAEQGVTLSLTQENNKPKLLINKSAAQLSGASFSATLLSLARLI